MISVLEHLYNLMVTGTLGVLSASAEKFFSQLMLNDDEKDIIKEYSCKLFWCTVLEYYIENKIALNDKEKIFLKRAVLEVKDKELMIKLNKFLNNINKEEAKKLYRDIYEGIPKDVIKDFGNIMNKLSKYNKV